MLECVRQFDQLSRYAPNMVKTETSKVWRFLSGLRPIARLVDTRRDGLESYADVVGRVIQKESWTKTEKNVSLDIGDGLKEVLQPNPL